MSDSQTAMTHILNVEVKN